MPDIYLHDRADSLTFRVAGDLTGVVAVELAQAWKTARSTSAHKRLIVDVANVVRVDAAAEDVMREMASAGADLISGSPLTDQLARRLTQRDPRPISDSSPGRLLLLWCRLRGCCRRAGDSVRQYLPCARMQRKRW